MADEVRECHEEETFDECVTEKYMEVLKAECDCLPLNLRIHDEVKEENTIVRKAFQMCGQGPRAGRWFNKLHQEVQHRQGGWGHSLDYPPCSDKSQNSGFFEEINFL